MIFTILIYYWLLNKGKLRIILAEAKPATPPTRDDTFFTETTKSIWATAKTKKSNVLLRDTIQDLPVIP